MERKNITSCRKINICMITPLGYTGMAYYDHSLCQSLAKLGVDIVMITSKYRIVTPSNILYKVKGYFIGTYGNLSRTKKGLNYFFCMMRILSFIIKNKFKGVHFQLLELPEVDIIIFIFLRILGVKIVFTPHNIYSFKGKRNRLFKMMYKLSNFIIVHNSANKDMLQKEFGIKTDRIEIIRHGNYNYFLNPKIQKDEAKGKIGIAKNKRVILLFGNIRAGKGIETAISAVKMLNNRHDFILLIAGKPAKEYDVGSIKLKVRSDDLENLIVIRDYFIEDKLIEYYYKASDVVLIPYVECYESGVLKYAFSCGVPVIVSDLKEFCEFSKDKNNCLIFNGGDPRHLSEKINFLFNNPEIAKKIAENSKVFSDTQWNWEKSAHQTKEIYEKIL